jgi:tetratricopeptide (TPR) repeat protein
MEGAWRRSATRTPDRRNFLRQRLALLSSFVLAATLGVGPPGAPEHGIGNVHMPISCGPDANARFDRGLALMHSFWYDRALSEFDATIKAHPDCAIAYWGAAMTYNHPLWAEPTDADVRAARGYLDRAKKATARDSHEAAYLAAAGMLYGDGTPAQKQQRDEAYRDAMRTILATSPDDETKLFTALSILAVRGGTDDARREAASLAQDVQRHQADHPGALHYLIHAYDTDSLAVHGLPAARAYAATAPAVPHALHMPSHIFLRVGSWNEARDSNLAAWAASEDAVKRAGEPQSQREFHGLQFGQYATLQLGRYAEAKHQAEIALDQYDANLRRITAGGLSKDDVDDLRSLDFEAVGMTAAHALSSGDYSLVRRLPAASENATVTAVARHVRAMAAIAAGDARAMDDAAAGARAAIAAQAGQSKAWAAATAITSHETLAAIAHARHDDATAFRELDAAVDAEDARPWHIQPTYPPVPAHEMYGRLLLDAGSYAAAASHFRSALKQFPNRALAELGLARASHGAGDLAEATRWSTAFTTMWSNADSGLPQMREAAAAR